MRKFRFHRQFLLDLEVSDGFKRNLPRGAKNKGAIAEEIADVLVVLEQMVILHDCERAVICFREQKLKRLKERIEGA